MDDKSTSDSAADAQEKVDETLATNDVDQAELAKPAEEKAELAGEVGASGQTPNQQSGNGGTDQSSDQDQSGTSGVA